MNLGVLTAVSLNVDDIPRQNLLFLQAVVDGGIQLQLLGALHTLQANDDVCNDFTIPACLQYPSRVTTRLVPTGHNTNGASARQASKDRQAPGYLQAQRQCNHGFLMTPGRQCILQVILRRSNCSHNERNAQKRS